MDDGTFLENYLTSLETLPNDVRRDFELVNDFKFTCNDRNINLIAPLPSFMKSTSKNSSPFTAKLADERA